jgi:hypothetical protein
MHIVCRHQGYANLSRELLQPSQTCAIIGPTQELCQQVTAIAKYIAVYGNLWLRRGILMHDAQSAS